MEKERELMRSRHLVLGLTILIIFCFVAIASAGVSGPSTAIVDTPVLFTYSGTGTIYQWCFGDGDASCTQWGSDQDNPVSHTYTKTGTFEVTAWVDKGNGAEPYTHSITVS